MTDVDITDKRGYTPLHMAAISGANENLRMLLNKGAKPNKAGDYGVTPLHEARTSEASKILIRHGADECLPCTLTSAKPKDGDTRTAFEMSVDLRPTIAEFCLDQNIYTNGKDLTSRELSIIIDLGVIINSGRTDSDKRGRHEYNEMTIHKKLSQKQESTTLLEHPLSETFLILKHQLLGGFAYWNLTFFFLFVASLTLMSIVSTNVRASCPNNTTSSVTYCFDPRDDCHRMFWDVFEDAFPGLFWVLYFVSWSSFGIISLREMSQFYSNPHRYVLDKENWLEIVMLALTAGYLATLLSNPIASPHLGALSLLSAWADFALLIGRFPSIGIYIYMSIHIMKKIVPILLSFLPILFGFAASFHILIPDSNSFDNIFISNLKALVMMSGEFEFEDNFRSEQVIKHGGSDITTQFVFILFLFLVSIVISNLLIGLTVNETEIVFKSALDMRLERTFSQIDAVEDLLATSLYKCFSRAFKIKRPTVLRDYLRSYKADCQTTNSFKIAITPNYIENDGYWWEKLDLIGFSIFRGINHPVYIYNDHLNIRGKRLAKLELPDETVKRIFKIVSDREQIKELPGGELAPTKITEDKIPNHDDNVTNLIVELKEREKKLEEQSRQVQEKLENVEKIQKNHEEKIERQITLIERSITGKVENQIKQSQESIEEKLARLEGYLTRMTNVAEDSKL